MDDRNGQIDAPEEALDQQAIAASAAHTIPGSTDPTGRRRGVLGLLAGVGIIAIAAIVGLISAGDEAPTNSAAKPASTAATAPEPDRDADGTPDRWDGEPDDPTWNAGAPRPEPTPADPAEFAMITERDWALIAKNPDAHIGEQIVLYAEVAQFDSATGSDTFRAYASADTLEFWTLDGTNTVFTGDARLLGPVVQGDIVKIHATVTGSLSYDTQIGGNTTVPSLVVGLIDVIGARD